MSNTPAPVKKTDEKKEKSFVIDFLMGGVSAAVSKTVAGKRSSSFTPLDLNTSFTLNQTNSSPSLLNQYNTLNNTSFKYLDIFVITIDSSRSLFLWKKMTSTL